MFTRCSIVAPPPSDTLSRGNVYKVEGCVWQVCSGEELAFQCGPTGGHCDLEQEEGGSGLIDLKCYGWYSQVTCTVLR